jgi:hypothetical protein
MATLPIPRTCTTSPGLNVGKATESATSRPRKMTIGLFYTFLGSSGLGTIR